MGYEANATGTSYLSPPEEMLGKFALGPAQLNVVANRSQPGAVATVKWDDEGVAPDEYAIVKDGVLVKYHATRDMSAQGKSCGCASSDNARNVSQLSTPNIAMVPGSADTSFEDLVTGLERGLVVVGGTAHPGSGGPVTTDRQQLNGEINGSLVYEVRNGKRTRFIRNSEVLFRAPELWKGLQAIGGQRSQVWTGVSVWKGQPGQQHDFGVRGVPARFNRVPVTDRSRQA
jgi:TldD protein